MHTGRPESIFRFDGGASSYLLFGVRARLLTVVTLGLARSWAICMQYRWRTEHTMIKWCALALITLVIYSFWVVGRLNRWTVEHPDFS